MPLPTVPRPRLRLAREPRSRSPIAEARIRSRVLRFLATFGRGKPRSVGEIHFYGSLTAVLPSAGLAALLETMVARGELAAVDDVPAGNVGGDRTPYRGYALPVAPEGESGGAA